MNKEAGLLFPISSLPNKYGVGDFGKEAYQLIDKMAEAHSVSYTHLYSSY